MLRAILAVGLIWSGNACAQDKLPPLSDSRPVVLVSASGPGSGPDNLARAYADIAKKYTDQGFVIENRTGGSGLVALTHVMSQPADGLTVQVWTRSFVVNHLTQPDAKNPIDDLHYIGIAMYAPLVMYTYQGSPLSDAKALLADCAANPGQQKWGGAYAGSMDWLITEIVLDATGCDAQYIPFDDGATLAAAVMGKHIVIGVGDMGDISGRDERLLPLMSTAAERDSRLPDVPTVAELGWNVVEANHRGFVTRKDIPDAAKAFHDALFKKVVADPAFAKFIDMHKAVIGGPAGPEMEAIVRETEVKAVAAFKEAGLTAN